MNFVNRDSWPLTIANISNGHEISNEEQTKNKIPVRGCYQKPKIRIMQCRGKLKWCNTRISNTHQHDHTYNELYRWHIRGLLCIVPCAVIHHVHCCVFVDVCFVLLLFCLLSCVCVWSQVHCGSLSDTAPGFYRPPHSCKPHVCVPDVWVGLAVWRCVKKKLTLSISCRFVLGIVSHTVASREIETGK